MRRTVSLVNVGLRGVMEVGLIAGFASWGYTVPDGSGIKILLAVLVPLAAFGFWGAVDFRFAGPRAESLRLAQELVVSGLAAVAFYAAGQHALGWGLAVLSLVHHGLVYALGERLLKEPPVRSTVPEPAP